MIRVMALVALLLAAVIAVLAAARFDRGAVLILFPPWRIEMSFILALAMTFALFVLTYIVFKLLRVALRLPVEVRARRERRLRDRAEDDLSRAVAALLSGQEAHARELAERSLRRHANPLAALVAARAALVSGDVPGARGLVEGMAVDDIGELAAARQAILVQLDAQTGVAPSESPAS
jgi:HemY protein